MDLEYKTSTLKNGIRVISVPLESTAAVTSLVLVGTGSHYETKKLNGISHYLEHLFFKGSKKYPSAEKISTILDGLGASYNAFTSFEETGFYVKTVADKADIALDVMSDYLKHPLFETKEIKKERNVILEELFMNRDSPMRFIGDLFIETLYGDQPAGWDVGGTEESMANIKPADIKKYFEKQYRGDNIVAVFSGNITHAKAKKMAKKHLEGLPKGNAYDKDPVTVPYHGSPRVNIMHRKSDQTHLALGFPGFDVKDERRYALDVLSVILGGGMSSRLFREVRVKRGLAYYVRGGSEEGSDFGYFAASAGVTNSKTEEAVRVIAGELKKIAKEGPSKEELTKAKNNIEGKAMLGLETSNAVATYFGSQEILANSIELPGEYIENIKSVKSKDVINVARDIFKPEIASLAMIGPHKDKKKFEEILKKLG